MPIFVNHVPALLRYQVTFDQPLQPAAILDIGNWSARWNLARYPCTAASVAGNIVTWFRQPFGPPDAGPNVVDFAPPPFDVIAAAPPFLPAPPFANFPYV